MPPRGQYEETMDDALSRGHPFELRDLWQCPYFGLEDDPTPLFHAELLPPKVFTFDNEQTLELPELALPDIADLHHDTSISSDDSRELFDPVATPELDGVCADDTTEDCWTLSMDLDQNAQTHEIHSWDTFDNKPVVGASKTSYFSESGPAVFSAALSQCPQSSRNPGFIPQPAILRAFCNLVLGQSSWFFQWNSAQSSFTPTLPDTAICGLSAATSKSVVERMIAVGSTYRSLAGFAYSSASSTHSNPAAVALKSCITDILAGIEKKLSSATTRCRSILQLQRLTDQPLEILKIADELVNCVESCVTEEQTISAISETIRELPAAYSPFSKLLEPILSRTCAPWLDHLRVDLGIGLHTMRANASSSLSLRGCVDSFSSKSSNNMPSFLTADDCTLIDATKESVAMIRQHLPEHKFSVQQGFPSTELSALRSGNRTAVGEHGEAVDEIPVTVNENLAWADEAGQQTMFALLDKQMSEAIRESPRQEEYIPQMLQDCLDDSCLLERPDEISLYISFGPFDRLRSRIIAHQQMLNATLLRHIFSNLQLRRHLDLHRQYHLLGNGDFVVRLSQALFSSHTQTAERRRGIVPTSEIMGLRLDKRNSQNWPPASSELGLILMGVLTETRQAQTDRSLPREEQSLPDGLSFAVRELSDSDIDRVMDSESIYALDFLRLQYTPPPCLDAILHTSTSQTYDEIFKFLLRLLRVRHVVTNLREHLLLNRTSEDSGASNANKDNLNRVRFALEAYDALTVLTSHFMDIGIESPWQTLDSALAKIERGLSAADTSSNGASQGMNRLRKHHEDYLERIRNRLFLRRRQEKLRAAIEQVLVQTLTCSLNMERVGNPVDTALFKRALVEMCDALRTALENPIKSAGMSSAENDDTESLKILLTSLSFND